MRALSRMNRFSSESLTRRRPDFFRALGHSDPPAAIEVDGIPFRLLRCLKHDSWAATAVYADPKGRKLACKINRFHPFFGVVQAVVLGSWLARRELSVFRELEGVEGFPRRAGSRITSGGSVLPTAVAHWWVEGDTFRPDARVDDNFFPALSCMLSVFQATGRAYVDMSKWGNIVIGSNGRPCLLDYQIHYRAGGGCFSLAILRQLQKGDWYYLRRHWRRCRPDQYRECALSDWAKEPWHIWLAERIGPFFRAIRIALLRLSGVRGDPRKDDEVVCDARDRNEAPARP
jgi:hypothetical protein